MRILLVNVPHPAVGSRIPDDHLPPLGLLAAHRAVIRTDQRLWDYKHQVLATRRMQPWHVLLWFKLIKMIVQGRRR